MMRHDRTLEELWHTSPPSDRVFELSAVTDLPPVARRYGAVSSCRLLRWGDINTGEFAYHPFGGSSDLERTFEGVTIPVRHCVGWSFGTSRFETEGEFFRCALHTVEFR